MAKSFALFGTGFTSSAGLCSVGLLCLLLSSGSLPLSGQTHPWFDQCPKPDLRADTLAIPADGGSIHVQVTQTGNCSIQLIPAEDWLTVKPSATQPGGFLITAAPNLGQTRWGHLRSYDAELTITQSPYSTCALSLRNAVPTLGMQGGLAQIHFALEGDDTCRWNASTTASWAHIQQTTEGSGNTGYLQVLVDRFEDNSIRDTIIVVNGIPVTIHQLGFDASLPAEVRALSDGAGFNSFHVAAGGLASIFGNRLATQVASATTVPLPTTLGGVRVLMKMPNGSEVPAPLLYVSPRQINIQVPEQASGIVQIRMDQSGRASNSYPNTIQPYYPSLFRMTAGYTILGALGHAHLVYPDGTGKLSPLITCDDDGCRANRVDRGPEGSTLYLTLYATGLPVESALGDYEVRLEHFDVFGESSSSPLKVVYAERHKDFVGLHQLNILVPRDAELLDRIHVQIGYREVLSSSQQVYFQPKAN